MQSSGGCGKEGKKQVQAVWSGWRKVSGVICDTGVAAKMKGKVYKRVVGPAMLLVLEMLALIKDKQ